MIVVDSSVWISHLRGETNATTARLAALSAHQDSQILIGDLILLEILQGARDEAHAIRIERGLRRFPVVAMLDQDLAVQSARHYRSLRVRGITIRKTIDLIIATFCLVKGHALLHADRDFDPFGIYLGLRIVPV